MSRVSRPTTSGDVITSSHVATSSPDVAAESMGHVSSMQVDECGLTSFSVVAFN